MDATCCDAEVRFPTDTNLLEDGNRLLDRLLTKFCAVNQLKKPSNHRAESRSTYVLLIKKKHKGKKLVDKTKLTQLRCFQADFAHLINYIAKFSSSSISCLTKRDIQWLEAAKTMYGQQKQMYDEKTHTCANRIISIYQSHIRPINRGKAKAKTEFGAKIGASIIDGYTYIDRYSWNAYNESSDLKIHLDNYQSRFGCLPAEVQADKIYLNKENRKLLQELGIKCFCRPLGRPPKEVDPKEASERLRAVGERNEVEATFGTSKRVYRANNIRAKLPDTAKVWIGACFFAKNIMKFLRELFALFFQICHYLSQISCLKPDMAQHYYNPANVVNCGGALN